VTFFVDNELVASCLGLDAIYFCRVGVFSSQKHFPSAAGEMHKYFLDGKIFARGGIRRRKIFSPARNAPRKMRRETGARR
jgi:hypothetical protein